MIYMGFFWPTGFDYQIDYQIEWHLLSCFELEAGPHLVVDLWLTFKHFQCQRGLLGITDLSQDSR